MENDTKLIIGVDLSLNSAGFCFKLGDKVEYLSVPNLYKFTSAKEPKEDDILKRLPILDDLKHKKVSNVSLVFTERLPTKKVRKSKGGTSNQQLIKRQKDLKDGHYLSVTFLNLINRVIDTHFKEHVPNEVDIIIEDMSLGKVTDNTVQVAEITMPTKMLLSASLLGNNFDRFYFIDAPSVKKHAGKGNFLKDNMMEAFLEKFDDDLSKYIKSLESSIGWFDNKMKKGKPIREVKAPLDDLVDARWLVDYHETNNQ